ncbi:MAG: hypothetical protein AABY22_03285 [Nanoarchaeota archaeon]
MKKCLYRKCENKVPTNYSYIAGDGSRVTDFCSEECMLHHIKHYEEDYK